jgi:hypothetical protein
VIELDVADLVLIAARTLGLGTDTALARLDVAAAEAALAEARQAAELPAPTPAAIRRSLGAPGALPDPAAAAAAAAGLMHALLRHRPCPGQGGRLAVAAGLQFLAVNGWRADLDPPGASASVIAGLESGRLSAAYVAAWLSPRLAPLREPSPRAASGRAPRPGLWFRAADLLRAPIDAVKPRHVAGVHTRATGFIPLTDDARDSVGLAWRLGGQYLDTEHILLGLIAGEGVAATALKRLGISPDAVRQQFGPDQPEPSAESITATPAAREVLARWALGEALGRGHRYIDTEDLLLALFRESDGAAAQALARLGAGESQVRGTVTALLAEPRG